MRGAAHRGEAEEGDSRLLAEEGAAASGGGLGDVDEFLGGGAGVDGAVGVDERAFPGGGGLAQVHDEAGAAEFDALGGADAVERGAQHVRGGGDGARDEAVDEAEGEHHVAEVESFAADGLRGLLRGHPLRLAAFEEAGGEAVGEGVGGVVDDLDGKAVERDAGLGAGIGRFGGRGEDGDLADALRGEEEGGLGDAGVHALGEDDVLAGGLGLGEDRGEEVHGGKLQITNYELRITNYKLRMTACN